MPSKRLLYPARARRLLQQFSWVDQRLVVVRERYIDHCDAHALAQRLSMDAVTLNKARQALIEAQLIAYERPLYQVLALDPPGRLSEREGRGVSFARFGHYSLKRWGRCHDRL